MKNLFKLLFATVLFVAITASSCKKDDDKDDDPVENKNFATLKAYMTSNSMDLSDVIGADPNSFITTAANVNTVNTDADTANDFYVIDIRAAADFTTGHIENSVNTTLKDIRAAAVNAKGHPIVVLCYTGQTACYGVTALRLSGYPTAKAIKWGMSGWSGENGTDKWTPNAGDAASGHANWAVAPGDLATVTNFGDPVIESSVTDGAGILKAQVDKLLAAGFQKTTNTAVLGSPSDFFINNFWDAKNVEDYGNIKGAVRIKPLTLAGGQYQNYDPSKTAITYCWTGQTSALVTAYMNVIGYKAKSLVYGANGMIHSDLASHKWSASQSQKLPVVTK